MSETYRSEVTVADWSEDPYPKEFPAVSHATWKTSYEGDLSGSGTVRILLTYTGGDPDDPSSLEADYVGYETIEATAGDRSGTFVLRVQGSHGSNGVEGSGEIVAGSGTGDFAGIGGKYEAEATGMTYPVSFTLDADSTD